MSSNEINIENLSKCPMFKKKIEDCPKMQEYAKCPLYSDSILKHHKHHDHHHHEHEPKLDLNDLVKCPVFFENLLKCPAFLEKLQQCPEFLNKIQECPEFNNQQ